MNRPPIQDVWLHIRSAASYPNGCEPQHCKRLRASTTSFNQDIPTAIAYPRDCCNASSLSSAAPTTIPNPVDTRDLAVGPRRSLQSFPSVCCHLRRDNFSLPMNYSKCCRDLAGTTKGYIGTPADHELLVLNHKGPMFASEPSWRLSDQSQPLTEHLNTLELLETVKVAYELTMGLLKFSNTEWLPNDWSLDDVSCLKSSSFDLGTLHVSQQLPHRRDRISIASEQDRAEGRIAASSARRTPLVSLAFVLLELAYHKPFVELKQDSDVDDIATARRLIQGIDMKLGNRFRSSIRMCLDGDFVVGCTDLSDGKVQTAVYNDVALKLDRLATDLEAILKLDD